MELNVIFNFLYRLSFLLYCLLYCNDFFVSSLSYIVILIEFYYRIGKPKLNSKTAIL